MTFAQRRNRLTTRFSKLIPVVKRRISVYHQSIHVTDSVTVTSLSANLLQNISAATDSLCQIKLN